MIVEEQETKLETPKLLAYLIPKTFLNSKQLETFTF